MTSEPRPVHIGAHHGGAWAGLVLCAGPGRGFAFRFAVRRDGRDLDLVDLYGRTHEVGPHAPDGSYARVSFALDRPGHREGTGEPAPLDAAPPDLTLEWARSGRSAVVGRVRLRGEGELLLHPWFPWDWSGRWEVGPGGCRGHTGEGEDHATVFVSPRADAEEGGAGGHLLRFPAGEVCFTAAVAPTADDATIRAGELLRQHVGGTLERAWRAYERGRVRMDGPWEGLGAALTNTLHWMVLLQPESGRRYTPAGRTWVFPRAPERGGGRDHWTLFGWDSCFNALELAVEAPGLALETLEAGLATAYENGCVPNWRGRFGGTPDRSQPPVGSLAAVKLWLRTGRREVLERTYPALARWASWWREPEGGRPRRAALVDGLFSWGSDAGRVDPLAPPWERDATARQRAAWESGQDDLPTWDECDVAPGTGVLDLVPVDLNCYRALDEECLARMAEALGHDEAAAGHARRASALRSSIDEHLWDPETSSYRDRLRDGSWARCRSASHLLPLAAGVPDDARAAALVDLLLDEGRFWGEWVIPTVSRDDPHFPEQQYWRGTIWPPVNYLVQQGLRRYGFDVVAGEVAARSAELFLRAWRTTGLSRENFDARTGRGGGRYHQSWGPLLALVALEELIDVTPWEGFKVGGLRPPGPSGLRNVTVRGRRWDVELGPGGLELSAGGRPVLTTDRPAVLRELEVGDGRLAARVHAERPLELRTWLSGDRFRAELDGEGSEVPEPRLRIPAGHHRIVLTGR